MKKMMYIVALVFVVFVVGSAAQIGQAQIKVKEITTACRQAPATFLANLLFPHAV